MKKNRKNHPEVEEFLNICEVSPKTKETKKVCDEAKKHSKDFAQPKHK